MNALIDPERGTLRWSVSMYESLLDTEILNEFDKTELIDGEILPMSPVGVRHNTAVTTLENFFKRHFERIGSVRREQALIVDGFNAPLPDVCLVRGKWTDYARRHPSAADALAVVEVCDTTQERDYNEKRLAYGRAGIAHFFILDLKAKRLTVYTGPMTGQGGYAGEQSYDADSAVSLRVAASEARPVTVSALLGLTDELMKEE